MGVEFNGKIGAVTHTNSTTAATNISESSKLGIMGFGHGNNNGGLAVERHIPGLDNAIAHFAGVPDFEYNLKGENLVIAGDIIPDRLEEREFCEV